MKYELKGNYFDGDFHYPPTTGPSAVVDYIKKTSPADTDLKLWKCPIHYPHVDNVLDSSVEGYKVWKKTSLEERIQKLKNFQEVVLTKADQIAEAISLEMGKPLWEAKTEAAALAGKVKVTIEDSLDRIKNKRYDSLMPQTNAHVIYKPLGPALVIGPFNFPCHLANGQILSALIAGNSVVFKPSEKTCYAGQLLIESLHEAGFPKGVVNMIQGDGEVARRLVKDRRVRGVFFTGSKEVGLKILGATHMDLGKLVALELGGKNTSIIHSDAQMQNALAETLRGAFLTSGQRCTSTSLVAIHNSIKDEFIQKFHELTKKIIIDHPIDHEKLPFMGPLVDQQAMETYLTYVGMAKREGIEEIMRGKQIEKATKGHYVTPSIHLAEKMDTKSHFLMNEIFGPNCTFIGYDELEEAIEISNATEYGLAASVFTQDQDVYQTCLHDIDAGLVNLNRSTVGASAKLPFGGVKNSGNYRPAAVATIDSCVYQLASLEVQEPQDVDLASIQGLDD